MSPPLEGTRSPYTRIWSNQARENFNFFIACLLSKRGKEWLVFYFGTWQHHVSDFAEVLSGVLEIGGTDGKQIFITRQLSKSSWTEEVEKHYAWGQATHFNIPVMIWSYSSVTSLFGLSEKIETVIQERKKKKGKFELIFLCAKGTVLCTAIYPPRSLATHISCRLLLKSDRWCWRPSFS